MREKIWGKALKNTHGNFILLFLVVSYLKLFQPDKIFF